MTPKRLLIVFFGLLTAVWAWDALIISPMQGDWLWLLRQNGLYLTGLWSIGFMSLAMVLATRPAWLETPMNGMDKIYRAHKWAGILAIAAGVAHWLIKQGGSPLKDLIGTAGRPAKLAVLPLLSPAHGFAKDVGEWGVYALIFMLLVSLWKRFPYRQWRLVHKAMPVLYLVLVFHTVVLLPAVYWAGVTGLLIALLLVVGTASALSALWQHLGKRRQHDGRIVSLQQHGDDVLEVTCRVEGRWPGHRPGQFAFVTFEPAEGAHPFTIASAPVPDASLITFQIKALGDYTRVLPQRLSVGQNIRIEGPYGRFQYGRARRNKAQTWVAGGIGVTPFLAWLEAMVVARDSTPVDFHYCVRNADQDPFVKRIQALCRQLPTVSLHLYDASRQQRLDVANLIPTNAAHAAPRDIWYCGPAGLARTLREGVKALRVPKVVLHQEAFEMR